ncbi:hypothetical protein [Afipia felis]|uniref:Uncharacterized protein n=2 Tax=Afipia felis TaxID=1035 RepID=A0A380W5M4_AFIFE|nr:hypothetical protein [Afipia felis]EKS26698.1 hypothetical protein HMPREF9697_04001 [Afipia felis ATCC 53690]SUU76153.1 Uncharacterised protein [Afipia felis]SUU84220.1 Uncharacterised protein [Afipia felis]SUW28210.1 Uncharacterised protein [Afipia felis]
MRDPLEEYLVEVVEAAERGERLLELFGIIFVLNVGFIFPWMLGIWSWFAMTGPR